MRIKMELNPKYSVLKEVIQTIPENFSNIGVLISSGENESRSVTWYGFRIVIKCFKYNALVNSCVYRIIRKSMAQCAYENTEHLLNLGVTSPEQIAYISCYKNGMLIKDFYICLVIDYEPFQKLTELPLQASLFALKAFARFTYKLHQLGIFHKDYSVHNILYSYINNEYDFALIDNDRISFSKFSFRKGMKSLPRLSVSVDFLGIIAAEYSREVKVGDLKTLFAILLNKRIQRTRNTLKKFFKSLLKYKIISNI